jgi:carboxyl-terminal processing protease
MLKTKYKYLLPLVLGITLSLGLWIGNVMSPSTDFNAIGQGQQKYQKIQDIIEILDRRYVDTVNNDVLFEETIADMLHKLDPHSNYIPARDLQLVNEAIQGKFGGVGVRFFLLRDTICITHVIKNSPSEEAGLFAGDKIIQIDGKKVAGVKISNEKIMDQLKGQERSPVKVQILRAGKLLNRQIIRGSIPIESVVCASMLNSKTGYIRIDQFSISTADEFKAAVEQLKTKGMKKLVIDLRNNGGGVLTGATQIADECLNRRVPIVQTKGEHTGIYTYWATSGGLLDKSDLAVIINENSASASEILAGALQDNDRATIVGRRSFGKGLVQEDIMLRDGSNLRLTIARYYTPTGRCIQKPYNGSISDYYMDQYNRYENGEMYAPDTTVMVDSLKFKTPKGKIVYGGGGIMPDVFVPYDSAGTSLYYTNLRYSPAFQAFAFDFVQDKRNKWNSVKHYMTSFTVSDELINKFANYAEKEFKVRQNTSQLNYSKKLIRQALMAEIARQLWVEQGYYTIVNGTDKEVLKSVELLK